MYKHLLLPTDGSLLSEDAIQRGMRFAREAGAKVTGLHVLPAFQILTYRADMLEDTRATFEKNAHAHAEKTLAFVRSVAHQEGVACETLSVASEAPYQAIIQTARDRGCDLIFMASHGRRGIEGLLLGSETQKVLTHSKIPVLVHR